MASERRWAAVPPVQVTATGTKSGKISVTSASGFKVKQTVQLVHSTLGRVVFQVKRVPSPTQLELGSPDKDINDRSDLTGYDTTTIIYADEQPRPKINPADIDQATYEEEPTVARRVIQVDEFGNKIGPNNPLPVTGTIQVTNFNYDRFELDYDSNKALVEVRYFLSNTLVRTIDLTRDADGDITDGTRT